MYICICNPVTDRQVRKCVRQGACTLSDLQMELGVAAQCGMCAEAALSIIDEERTPVAVRQEPSQFGLSSA
jgi:bacterioferritin-associated ferredoxin